MTNDKNNFDNWHFEFYQDSQSMEKEKNVKKNSHFPCRKFHFILNFWQNHLHSTDDGRTRHQKKKIDLQQSRLYHNIYAIKLYHRYLFICDFCESESRNWLKNVMCFMQNKIFSIFYWFFFLYNEKTAVPLMVRSTFENRNVNTIRNYFNSLLL